MLRAIRDAHFARAALGTLISSLPSQGKVGSWVVQKIFPATEAAWREALATSSLFLVACINARSDSRFLFDFITHFV